MNQARRSLLFVAPVMPAAGGNGLAMRAGAFLDAFARDFRVTLLVVPVAGGSATVPLFVRERAQHVVSPPLAGTLDPLWDLCLRVRDPAARASAIADYPRPALCCHATTPWFDAVRTAFGKTRFDVVHVMRSYLAPYAAPFLANNPDTEPAFASIDLDDDEAQTHRRLALLYTAMGRGDDARIEAAEAGKYERLEADWLPCFNLRITCTAAHAQATAVLYAGGATAVVPNTVVLPWRLPRWRRAGQRLLFVGNLSYLPNSEGIRDLVETVLPLLRARRGDAVQLRIVGSAPSAEVLALARHPGVTVVANPARLAAHYRWADACVVPLAAGGGTRIKLLEAFAHGVPVVATHLGAEGIAVQDRVHLLLADTPADFAGACAELFADATLAAQLARAAHQLVATRYARALGTRIIRAAFATAIARRPG